MKKVKSVFGVLLTAWGVIREMVDLLESVKATHGYAVALYEHRYLTVWLFSSRGLTVSVIVVGLGLIFSEKIQEVARACWVKVHPKETESSRPVKALSPSLKTGPCPEVVISKITCDTKGMFPETVLTLHNANKTSAAQRVRVCDIELSCGKATFREIPLLVADGVEVIVPHVKSDEGVFRQRDLLNLIRTHCLNNAPGELKECTVPGVIVFEDLGGNSFETHFEFAFYPLAHTMQKIALSEWVRREQIILEARRFSFRSKS